VHCFLVKLLEKTGLRYADINLVWRSPADVRVAVEKAAVDVWVIWESYMAAAEQGLSVRLLADANGVVKNRAYYFSSKVYAQNNADVLKLLIEELCKLDVWAQNWPACWACRRRSASVWCGVWHSSPKPYGSDSGRAAIDCRYLLRSEIAAEEDRC
jgi:hypothetical protein